MVFHGMSTWTAVPFIDRRLKGIVHVDATCMNVILGTRGICSTVATTILGVRSISSEAKAARLRLLLQLLSFDENNIKRRLLVQHVRHFDGASEQDMPPPRQQHMWWYWVLQDIREVDAMISEARGNNKYVGPYWVSPRHLSWETIIRAALTGGPADRTAVAMLKDELTLVINALDWRRRYSIVTGRHRDYLRNVTDLLDEPITPLCFLRGQRSAASKIRVELRQGELHLFRSYSRRKETLSCPH
jgi:hypothetical protein